MLPTLLTAVIALLWIGVAGSVSYLLLLLAAASLPPPRRPTLPPGEAAQRLAVVVPAHDEELVLAATLNSLSAQSYPKSLFEIIVVADNCTDATAAIARAQGATVLERQSETLRGKGHALHWAFSLLLTAPNPADVFVIVDADTWAAPDFLEKMAARLPRRGFGAIQGRYGVLNDTDGWRAALMSAAFDLVNHVKPLGRARLGLGAGLKGNGMAFTHDLLQAAPWRGDSVTEDIDYALELARTHGVRVGYAPDALVRAQMPTTARQAASQRSRWEEGRYRLLRECGLPLLADGLRRRNAALCDAALDLCLPPLAELAALVAGCAALVASGSHFHRLPHALAWQSAVGVAALGLLVYVLGGLRLSGAPRGAYLSLAFAPLYALWKFAVYGAGALRRRAAPADAPTEWVRTARTPVSSSMPEGELP